ncbi:MAG: PadR family transcriptional regulator [Thermoprotei archaeon]|nr:MAG: PadR family transcriptional regulator [Thermoprotei archaeon]
MFRGKFYRKIKKELSAGFYTVIIMLILSRYGACYGYKVIKIIRELSQGFLNPSESTVYELLHSLQKEGLVKSYWAEVAGGVPRKYYELTEEGKKRLNEVLSLVEDFLKVFEKIKGELL